MGANTENRLSQITTMKLQAGHCVKYSMTQWPVVVVLCCSIKIFHNWNEGASQVETAWLHTKSM